MINRAELLDCSCASEALQSLSRLFGTTPEGLRSRWGSFRLDDPQYGSEPPENRLILHLGYEPEALPQPSAIRWFHATRAMARSDFRDGVLPTTQALPHVWDALGTVVERQRWISQEEWQQFREGFWQSGTVGARQFGHKYIAPGWEGPFAFLVRDAAVSGLEAGHRDFTRLSEATEDIGMAFEELYQLPLRDAIRRELAPCLVVFTRPGNWYGAVRAALNYVFRVDRRMRQHTDCNTCYSGGGQAVPASWIDRVEWL